MTTETANFVALVLGGISVLVAIFAIWVQIYLSRMMNKHIEKEDERAKNLIKETQRMIEEMARKTDEGNERLERFIKEGNERLERFIEETQRMIDEGNKRVERILLEVLKRV